MVDEYFVPGLVHQQKAQVQIPLWSMNTKFEATITLALMGSDSSMVDEYQEELLALMDNETVQIPLWSMNTSGAAFYANNATIVQIPLWSMNTNTKVMFSSETDLVQIPLWSMNTLQSAVWACHQRRSDSSMVDEYM